MGLDGIQSRTAFHPSLMLLRLFFFCLKYDFNVFFMGNSSMNERKAKGDSDIERKAHRVEIALQLRRAREHPDD